MVAGSIAVPGAIVMVNNNLPDVNKNRLISQLHITETITGEEFDLRLSLDPLYARNIRVTRQRLLVLRDHNDKTNRTEMDVVLYVKHDLASIEKNCFGPPGPTYMVNKLTWAQLCIYHTVPDRTCQGCSCSQSSFCVGCDGYLPSPYYPAIYDPMYPQENHDYYQTTSLAPFGGEGCNSSDYCLCRTYTCTEEGCIPGLDCRLVKV